MDRIKVWVFLMIGASLYEFIFKNGTGSVSDMLSPALWSAAALFAHWWNQKQ